MKILEDPYIFLVTQFPFIPDLEIFKLSNNSNRTEYSNLIEIFFSNLDNQFKFYFKIKKNFNFPVQE